VRPLAETGRVRQNALSIQSGARVHQNEAHRRELLGPWKAITHIDFFGISYKVGVAALDFLLTSLESSLALMQWVAESHVQVVKAANCIRRESPCRRSSF
jgi:hypothetical protein